MPKISILTPTIRGDEALKFAQISLANQSFKDFEWIIEKHNPDSPPDFNAAMNRMLKKSSGELIVFLQDYIRFGPKALEYFWNAYKINPQTFFTAPVGKTEDNINISWDWRKYRSEREGCNFMEWEIDWACAPKNAIIAIGGFDQELDKYWGFDNVNIGFRAVKAGFKIKNLRDNQAVAWDHNSFTEHPYQKLRNEAFHNARLKEIEMGIAVIKYG